MKNPETKTTLDIKGTVLFVKGNITFNTVVDIWEKGTWAIQKMHQIRVDLAGISEYDSSVLALCTAWMRAAARQKKTLTFSHVPTFMQELLKVHGLNPLESDFGLGSNPH